MKRTNKVHEVTRRQFMKSVGVAGAALATTLWLPRRARASATGSVKRVILVNAPGGVRWDASFDGQRDPKRNPWGLLSWSLVGSGAPPSWGFSRMLLQRPLPQNATDWSGVVYPYLSSDDPAHYNLARVPLA